MSAPDPTPRLLLLFTLINLIVGSSAFVINGLVAPVALSLGTSVAAVGQAMTAYALSTAVLAPLLLMATGRWSRRRALVLALALFTAGNALSALADELGTLIAGRAIMGMGAMVTPVMAALAVALVEPARRGRALALVFMGMSLSYVIGIPLGAWLGFALGWHAPVWVATALSALATLAAWRWVPADLAAPGATFAGLGDLLRRPALLAVIGLTLLYFIAIFAVFSYIGPVLQGLVPMSNGALSGALALFGVAGVGGTLLGGRLADRYGTRRTLSVQLALLTTMMLLLPLTAGHALPMMAVMMIWGVAGFGMMAPQQARLAQATGMQTPLALSLNSSMLYLGTALGAAVGGLAVTPLGFERLSWVGAPFAAAGWLLLMLTTRPAATARA
jgi:MFS transporter, DHA1 family, inner membrane transport protein